MRPSYWDSRPIPVAQFDQATKALHGRVLQQGVKPMLVLLRRLMLPTCLLVHCSSATLW